MQSKLHHSDRIVIPSYLVDLSSFDRGIAQTCRLLRKESLELMYTASHLEICSSHGVSVHNFHSSPFVQSIPAPILQHTKALAVDYRLLQDLPFDRFLNLDILVVTRFKAWDYAAALDPQLTEEGTLNAKLMQIFHRRLGRYDNNRIHLLQDRPLGESRKFRINIHMTCGTLYPTGKVIFLVSQVLLFACYGAR